jgi:hypothetical protein
MGLYSGKPKKATWFLLLMAWVTLSVLRQEDTDESSYRLIGFAIIDELMDGEAFEMVKVGTLDKQTILLR